MNHTESRGIRSRSFARSFSAFGLLAVLTLLAPAVFIARLFVYAGVLIAAFFGLFGPPSFPFGSVIGLSAATWLLIVGYDMLYEYASERLC